MLGDGGEQRDRASLREERVEPFVVLGREREEELLLGREQLKIAPRAESPISRSRRTTVAPSWP